MKSDIEVTLQSRETPVQVEPGTAQLLIAGWTEIAALDPRLNAFVVNQPPAERAEPPYATLIRVLAQGDVPALCNVLEGLIARGEVLLLTLRVLRSPTTDAAAAVFSVEGEPGRLFGKIHLIATRPCEQRSGVGRQLVARVVRECRRRGAGAIWGDCMQGNTVALTFWRNLGFEFVYSTFCLPRERDLRHSVSEP